jgi:3-oxoacyl-[acyl-carrier protein] reductase
VTDQLDLDAVLITGAGHGIGRDIALDLGRRGVEVVCVARTDSGEKTAATIRAGGGSATAFALDLADFRHTEQILGAWAETSRPQRCAAILAAAVLGPQSSGASFNLSAWEETFRVNVLGNLAAANAVLPAMCTAGFGRIIFFSGGGAALPFPTFPAYAASKTVIARIVEHLHHELEPFGDLAVVSLAPGSNPTRTLSAVQQAAGPIRTLCTTDESVNFVIRFLTADVRRLSGRLVHVRDDWSRLTELQSVNLKNYWKLRRVELCASASSASATWARLG